MTISQIHPEDLVDKDARGKLTESERARLEAHLADCSTCRFERQVRMDFAEELDDEAEFSTQQLVALVEGLPREPAVRANDTRPPAPPPPQLQREEEPVQERPSSRPLRQAHRRATLGMLVAATLLVGGVATAGAGAHVWARLSATFGAATDSDAAERAAPAPTEKPTVIAKAPPALAKTASETSAAAPDEPTETTPPTLAATPVGVATTTATKIAAAPATVAVAFAGADTAASLFDDANEARRRGDYARAIFLHRRLEALFPKSREAQVSYATIGRLLLDRGDATGALASFDAYEARGSGPLDEAVLVGRATALDRLGRTDEGRAAWRTLLTTFPATPYASHARARIDLHDGSAGASPR